MAALHNLDEHPLVDELYGAVHKRRQLSYDERRELRRQISDRVRELVPYIQTEGYHKALDTRIERMAAGLEHGSQTVKEADEKPLVLSRFECDILAGMMQGRTDAETARILGVSKATVSKYALVAVHKLGAKNRAHAVARIFAAVTADASASGDRGNGPGDAALEGAGDASASVPMNEEARDLMRDLFDFAGEIEQRHSAKANPPLNGATADRYNMGDNATTAGRQDVGSNVEAPDLPFRPQADSGASA